MYKKILFTSCLTEYCDHIFKFALNLARENDAKLWIYHGLGALNLSETQAVAEIKKAEERLQAAYVDKMKKLNFTNYMINVTQGDVVREITKLAKNVQIDVLVMGTSTKTPIDMGGSPHAAKLGPVVKDVLLASPCPVLVIPPALVPGLA